MVGNALKAKVGHQPIKDGCGATEGDRINQPGFSGLGIDLIKKRHRSGDNANGVDQARRAIYHFMRFLASSVSTRTGVWRCLADERGAGSYSRDINLR